ncbi:MAG: LacI family DNA-binding transcriptional regulator [Stappiaceae bacterium]
MKTGKSNSNAVAKSAPKIKDVARVAGVSVATVSRTLSKPNTVAEGTRNAVLAAAKETGYRVNLAARNLRRQRAGAVVVLVPNLGNPFFSHILAGIESTLANDDLSVLVVDTQQSKLKSEFFYEYLHIGRADGIISLDGSLSSEKLNTNDGSNSRLPIVFACEWSQFDDCPSVRVNNRRGAGQAIQHLAELGHKHIGFLNGPEGNVLSVARKEGALRGFQTYGLNVVPEWFFEGDFSMDAGVHAANNWLGLSERPTAIFCANDESALGLISTLHQNGVEVPRDVSVIGFDDLEVSEHFIPPLTTISQPRMELGIAAAKLLTQQMEDPFAGDLPKEVLPVELVIRKSTAKLPS